VEEAEADQGNESTKLGAYIFTQLPICPSRNYFADLTTKQFSN
jgi:hypothetical protein